MIHTLFLDKKCPAWGVSIAVHGVLALAVLLWTPILRTKTTAPLSPLSSFHLISVSLREQRSFKESALHSKTSLHHSDSTDTRAQSEGTLSAKNPPEKSSELVSEQPQGQQAGQLSEQTQQQTPRQLYATLVRNRIDSVLDYPFSLRKKGIQGVVHLQLILNHPGHLDSVQVIKSSGFSELDQLALQAVTRAAPFPPFTPDLMPDPMGKLKLNLPMEFEIK